MNETCKQWWVYILQCADNTLYTGITIDLQRRIAEHNSAKGGAKYTRARKPVSLIYFEEVKNRSVASKREYQIKKMHLKKKLAIISSD